MLAIVAGALLLPAGWTVDRLVPSQYATINAAVLAAQSNDRIIVSGTVTEPGDTLILTPNLTIMGNPGNDVRRGRFLIAASNITVQDLTVNGRAVNGDYSDTLSELFSIISGVENTVFDGCTIINPATGEGSGVDADDIVGQHTNSGACIRVRTGGSVTIRDCNMVCDNRPGDQNIVGIHFIDTNNGQGPYLIENTDFQVERRCIDIQSGISNLTVRNCNFEGFPGTNGSTGGVFIYTDDLATDQQVTDLLVQGCNFLGNGGGDTVYAGFQTVSGKGHNITVRDCYFGPGVGGDDFYWRMRGENLVMDGNTFEGSTGITMRMTVRINGGNNLQVINPGSLELAWNATIIRNSVFTNLGGQSISIGEGFRSGSTLESNTFLDIPAGYAAGAIDGPYSGVIRDNHIERCGTSSNLAGLDFVLNQSVVADNFILDCPYGIQIRNSRGRDANPIGSQAERSSTDSVVRRNIIINPSSHGIHDKSVDSGIQTVGSVDYPWVGRAVNMRYINNTIVRPAIDCMVVHGTNLSVYNNILFGGSGSMNVALADGTTADPTTNFVALGYNLSAGNQYKNITFPGGAQFPTTDVRLPSVNTPLFSGGPFPTTEAGVAPTDGAAAIDAGTANGIDADFVTDIGAIELGGVVNLSVPASGWELYR